MAGPLGSEFLWAPRNPLPLKGCMGPCFWWGPALGGPLLLVAPALGGALLLVGPCSWWTVGFILVTLMDNAALERERERERERMTNDNLELFFPSILFLFVVFLAHLFTTYCFVFICLCYIQYCITYLGFSEMYERE